MSRLFVSRSLSIGEVVPMEPDHAHYLGNVLRISADDVVILVDEAGREFRARLALKRGRDMALVVLESLDPRPGPALAIDLFAGLMKGKKMERIVRDATGLGVRSLTPFISSRTIPRDIGDMKLERMNKIAVEESRLSGRNLPLTVHPPVPLVEAVRGTADLSLMLWEEETREIGEVIRGLDKTPAVVALYTGPEGGLCVDEVQMAVRAGLLSVGLGRRILRAETAPLVAAAIVQYEWGDL
jgi:16S rRNA (uracil1498-N3)-methyltransferase